MYPIAQKVMEAAAGSKKMLGAHVSVAGFISFIHLLEILGKKSRYYENK